MPSLRTPLAGVAAALLLLSPLACNKKSTTPPAVTVVDDDGAGGGGGSGVIAEAAQPGKGPRPEGNPVRVQASVSGLGDVLALVKQATTAWTPKDPLDAAAYIQAMLLQLGYGPGLWASLDLAGVMAVDTSFFAQNPTADLRLIGSVAATNPKGVMEAMPSGQRPQPLGNGLWELVQGDVRVLLREQAKSLEFALSEADLARAGGLAGEVRGRRIQVRGTDLPPGLLSGDLVPGLPRGLRRQVSAVLGEATSAAVSIDAGTDRDLLVEVSAAAPFERLGLGPLGPARSKPTALEGRLPGSPVFVVAIPLGNPELLHKAVDSGVKAAEGAGLAGGPFEAPVRAAARSAHTLLDQLRDDVVFALYLSPKGEAAVLVAADVKDDAAARAASRELLEAVKTAVTGFNSLAGNNKDATFGVAVKADAVKAGAARADLLTLSAPKNLAKDVEDAQAFLTRKLELEVVTAASGNTALMAVGAGARDLAAALGAPKQSLGPHPGLALARSASQGCHFCVAVDPGGLARFGVAVDADMRADKTYAKDIEAGAATVTRLGGALGIGLRLEPKQGSLAAGLSKSLLVLSPADAAQVSKLFESVTAKQAAPEDKPLGGGSSRPKEDKPLGGGRAG
ncbi:MAG: hypothetical protein JNL82_37185 [Myxococcales bacterium]|nr:hypothetical protein [Myxococcales bacterium]